MQDLHQKSHWMTHQQPQTHHLLWASSQYESLHKFLGFFMTAHLRSQTSTDSHQYQCFDYLLIVNYLLLLNLFWYFQGCYPCPLSHGYFSFWWVLCTSYFVAYLFFIHMTCAFEQYVLFPFHYLWWCLSFWRLLMWRWNYSSYVLKLFCLHC